MEQELQHASPHGACTSEHAEVGGLVVLMSTIDSNSGESIPLKAEVNIAGITVLASGGSSPAVECVYHIP